MRERKATVTLKATSWELERWGNAAYTARRRDVPAFLTFAANATARYIRELDRLRSPDAVMTRQGEKRNLGALLKAAREAVEYLPPKPVERYLHGPLDVRRNLRRAIEAVDDFLQRYGEEYPCD
jgi:hypothetical protein